MLEIVGRVLYCIFAVMALFGFTMQWREYRRFDRGEDYPKTLSEAWNFVEYSIMAVWFLFGAILIPICRINPWWCIAWFISGGVTGSLFKPFMDACGLTYLVETGNEAARASRTLED